MCAECARHFVAGRTDVGVDAVAQARPNSEQADAHDNKQHRVLKTRYASLIAAQLPRRDAPR
jgi:tRNA U38,U39,U40 pseudouridine synthase TruA